MSCTQESVKEAVDSVTGDTWKYGYMISASTSESAGRMNASGAYRYVMDGREATLNTSNKTFPVKAGGLAIQYDTDGVTIEALKNLASVKLTGLTGYTVKAEDKTYPMAKDVQAYLKQDSAYYLTALSSINASSCRLTGWYDDFPAGGRLRVIVAVETEG